jgi:hypothetical protein
VQPLLVSFCGRLNLEPSFVQLVYTVSPQVLFGNPKTSHRCNALVEHLSAVIFVRHDLCWLGSDQSSLMSIKLVQEFHAYRDQSNPSILNLFFCLAHNLLK